MLLQWSFYSKFVDFIVGILIVKNIIKFECTLHFAGRQKETAQFSVWTIAYPYWQFPIADFKSCNDMHSFDRAEFRQINYSMFY